MADLEHRHGAADAAGKRPQPAGDGAKKGGFAAAIRAGHQRDLAGRHAVRQRWLDDPHPACQRQTLDGKAFNGQTFDGRARRRAVGAVVPRVAAAPCLSM